MKEEEEEEEEEQNLPSFLFLVVSFLLWSTLIDIRSKKTRTAKKKKTTHNKRENFYSHGFERGVIGGVY